MQFNTLTEQGEKSYGKYEEKIIWQSSTPVYGKNS